MRHLSFLHNFCKFFYVKHSNSCSSTPIENWTHVYMNLFTQNSSYYHLLKYLLTLLKHPVQRQCSVLNMQPDIFQNLSARQKKKKMVTLSPAKCLSSWRAQGK